MKWNKVRWNTQSSNICWAAKPVFKSTGLAPYIWESTDIQNGILNIDYNDDEDDWDDDDDDDWDFDDGDH